MDFISGMFNELGTIPTLACIGVVGLLVYSIFFGGKGGGSNGTGSSNGGFGAGGRGPGPGAGSPPPPPPSV